MSFYADQVSQGSWSILASAVCESAAEAASVAKLWRKGNRGTGVQVRTKTCTIRALGAILTIYVVIEREKITQAARTAEPS